MTVKNEGEFKVYKMPPETLFLYEKTLDSSAINELCLEVTNIPKLTNCEIHVGSEDRQSNPKNVKIFADLVGIKVHVVQDGGHMLPKDYGGKLLDKWLS